MKVEKNFDFRKRMLEVHRRDLRDNTLLPDAQELEISDNFKIYLHKNADEVALTAAKDFTDYLFTSMGIKATITYTDSNSVDEGLLLILSADTTLDLGNANGYRGFRIDVNDKFISVCGYDNRGISQGLYYLEDCMTFRKAPFLKKGTVLRRPLYSPQMVHSGYKLDYYPNEHLSAIAHEGRDAILVFVNDVDKTPMGYLDFNELIARAARYGLDVYAYSYLKSEKHPDEPDAEAYYEGNYGKLFRMCPGLKGVTLVGESVEFPSKDPHVTGKTHRDNLVDGIPTGKTSPGWYPCMDFPQWLTLIKKIITRYKPDADIVFWTYNWGYRSEEERCKLIDALPEGITLQATFEMFEKFKTEGNTSYCADYTLSFEGYGHYFESEAKAAKKRNIKLYSMTNTGGLTWDFGVIPYEPFPYQWIKRYKKMKDAHDKWGLCGLMECHHYGFYPSFISKLSKWCFYDTDEPMEDILETIVKSEFGVATSDIVLSALEKWSEAITYFTPTNSDQYGAFRVGPSYPFCLYRAINLQSAPYSMFGNKICSPVYYASNDGRASISNLRVPSEMRSLEKMRALIREGLDLLDAVEGKNEALFSLINLGNFIEHTVVSGINSKKWYLLKCAMHVECDKEKYAAILDEMVTLLKDERANAEATIPIVQQDSRLGWEPSMEYIGDEEHIRWKLRQIDYVLNSEIENVRESLTRY